MPVTNNLLILHCVDNFEQSDSPRRVAELPCNAELICDSPQGLSAKGWNGDTEGMSATFSTLLQKSSTGIQMILKGPLKCRKLALSQVAGRTGIEIGGPSAVFSRSEYLPVYDAARSLDNCDFKQDTKWATHSASYRFHKSKPHGKMYFVDGTDLNGVPGQGYDFLLSSHCLEHIANPIKALKEWQRVVKPGGSFVIVLPHYIHTFDRKRKPTPLQHMVDDFERGTGEDDLTHFKEVYTPAANPSPTDLEIRDLLWNNMTNRMIHHHVFDESNSRQLLEAAGLKVVAVEPYPPFHIFLVAQSE